MQTPTTLSKPLVDGNDTSPMQSIINTTSNVRANVSHEFHNFISDIEDLVKQTTTLTGNDLEHAKTKLINRVAAAKNSMEDMGNDIKYQARKSATITNEYVHEQPWNAIGIGAVAGMLVGLLLARRS